MNSHDVLEVLARPLSLQLLESSIPARFAYTGLDGDPRVIPIGFLWTGEQVKLYTVPTSARALYQQMVVVTVTPDWAKLLDFETTLPKAVEDLITAHGDPR